MRVALYSRVSSIDQQTLPMQKEQLAQYAKARGWYIVLDIDEVRSGAKTRPKRDELLKLARQRKIDAILVWKLDRWGRSTPDLVATLHELHESGIRFVSFTEALDFDTPAGRAMAGMLAIFASFERDLLIFRVRAGIDHARKNGKHVGRKATVNGDEIRRLRATGMTYVQIRKQLNVSDGSIAIALSLKKPTEKITENFNRNNTNFGQEQRSKTYTFLSEVKAGEH